MATNPVDPVHPVDSVQKDVAAIYNRAFKQPPVRRLLILQGSFFNALPENHRANVPFSPCKCLILLGAISRKKAFFRPWFLVIRPSPNPCGRKRDKCSFWMPHREGWNGRSSCCDRFHEAEFFTAGARKDQVRTDQRATTDLPGALKRDNGHRLSSQSKRTKNGTTMKARNENGVSHFFVSAKPNDQVGVLLTHAVMGVPDFPDFPRSLSPEKTRTESIGPDEYPADRTENDQRLQQNGQRFVEQQILPLAEQQSRVSDNRG